MKKNLLILYLIFLVVSSSAQPIFEGKYFSGSGDTTYIQLLDKAYRMLRPDAELENLSMLYYPRYDGFTEGLPKWDMWWIQNSFGPTYTLLPFMDKAYQTFILNSQDLWFKHIGNGVRKDLFGYVGPVGCLCDAAIPEGTVYRQGDAKHHIHDWAYGMTTAGIILQSELLLINRNRDLINKYLPLLEQSADFIDLRRDTVTNIFLMGTAANLLAPSYAGSGKLLEDGTYEPAYLAEISVNYIAALNRLIELEKFVGNFKKVEQYAQRKEKVKEGLKHFITDEGYFIRSLDKNGTKHGLYGTKKHGYFEMVPNHDAMAFRVVDDEQAMKIYNKIKSIPELRPYTLTILNYPAYDDMYEQDGLFKYGKWVNGGHWTTTEARMLMGYYRVGAYEDAKASFKRILSLAPIFRLDNGLEDFGNKIQQDWLPINAVYDSWGAPGGFLRGLFEYEYKADGIIIYPHIPPKINRLEQKFPIYYGNKKIFISTVGSGEITSVRINGKRIKEFSPTALFLKPDSKYKEIHISFGLGNANAEKKYKVNEFSFIIPVDNKFWNPYTIYTKSDKDICRIIPISDFKKVNKFYNVLRKKGFQDTYEYKLSQLIMENLQAIYERQKLKESNGLVKLPLNSQIAADNLYINTLNNLYFGLNRHLQKSPKTNNERKIATLWHSN
ncbi:MAG: GH36-type glycosyl hydrolase domain-containing protein [Paludibacter sp.]